MAVVESIYSSLILDTKQYEEALRKIVGLSTAAESSFQKGFDNGRKSVDQTTASIKNASIAMEQLKNVAMVAGFGLLAKSVLQTTAQFEKYDAVLRIALGSQAAATKSLSMLQDFAAKTPFQLSELTEAYVKFVNRGLKPSEKELTAIGDVASSQGKSFLDLSQAILNASTGETEMLKQFGITAQQSGSKITLMFKDFNKTVERTPEAIQAAVVEMGNMKGVQGSMAAISQTLTGAWSNMQDAIDRLKVSIGANLSPNLIALTQNLTKTLEICAKFAASPMFNTILMNSGGNAIQAFSKSVEYLNAAIDAIPDNKYISFFVDLLANINPLMGPLNHVVNLLNKLNEDKTKGGVTDLALLGVTKDTAPMYEKSLRVIEQYNNAKKGTLSDYAKEAERLKTLGIVGEEGYRKLRDALNQYNQERKNSGPKGPAKSGSAGGEGKIQHEITPERIGESLKVLGQSAVMIANAVANNLNAIAQLAQAKLNTLKQNVDFFVAGLNKIARDQQEKTISDFDKQLASIDEQNQALLDQEREYLIKRELMKAEFDQSAKAENDRLFNQALDALKQDYEGKKEINDQSTFDEEQKLIVQEQLQGDFDQSKIKLRSDFDQKLLATMQVNDDAMAIRDKEQAKKKKDAEDLLAQQKEDALTKRAAAEKKFQDDEKKRMKEAELFKWASGKQAFDASKTAQLAAAQIQMAMGLIDAVRAGVMIASTLPFGIGIPIGAAVTATLSALIISAGSKSISAISGSQYPPPPVFADGGVVGGSLHSSGGTMINAERGELIVPRKNFDEVINSVSANRDNGSNTTNVYIDGVKVVQGYNLTPREIADQTAQIIRNDIYQAVSR